ncbi:MAG: hypothetical protein KKA79_02485 [Nanoarchaeota archaeon]|nr:hypothetical protein [Nanoarchaeota archaeon]MCG2718194.1 hypothetical protein [Nanoarchaeota archaeon]
MKIPKSFLTKKDVSVEDMLKNTSDLKKKRRKDALDNLFLDFNDYYKEVKKGILKDNESYEFALECARNLRYDVCNLQDFVRYVVNYDDKSGLYVSALINNLLDSTVDEIRIEPLAPLDSLANCISKGKLVIEGSVGQYLGWQMNGGELVVDGNATDYVGYNLEGGKIIVNGSVETDLGYDMNDGEIIIKGNAGEDVCNGMEGGKVTVYGNVEKVGAMDAGELHVYGDIHQKKFTEEIKGMIYLNDKKIWPKPNRRKKK